MSFVPVGPAKLRPEAGSEDAIWTEGRPRSVMRRNSTVSASSSFGRLGGREHLDARSNATLGVYNFQASPPQYRELALSECWTKLLRNREKQERQIHGHHDSSPASTA